MKVLVVDDNINARKLLVKMLVANNYEADEAIVKLLFLTIT